MPSILRYSIYTQLRAESLNPAFNLQNLLSLYYHFGVNLRVTQNGGLPRVIVRQKSVCIYKNTITVYLKQSGAKNGEFVCIDSPLARESFDYIMFGEITSTTSGLSTENKIYFDNIDVWSGIVDADIIYTPEREAKNANAKAHVNIVNPSGAANSVNVFLQNMLQDNL